MFVPLFGFIFVPGFVMCLNSISNKTKTQVFQIKGDNFPCFHSVDFQPLRFYAFSRERKRMKMMAQVLHQSVWIYIKYTEQAMMMHILCRHTILKRCCHSPQHKTLLVWACECVYVTTILLIYANTCWAHGLVSCCSECSSIEIFRDRCCCSSCSIVQATSSKKQRKRENFDLEEKKTAQGLM